MTFKPDVVGYFPVVDAKWRPAHHSLFAGSSSLPINVDDFLGLLASSKGDRASLIKYDANLKVHRAVILIYSIVFFNLSEVFVDYAAPFLDLFPIPGPFRRRI